ncbi:hypothetical protein LLE49_26800 [Alicyclobacillus tolerans]|uniref:hypothetical protein n=1 Tax=Alicyclobacillus tolerans TaxID=90970 RepID=UPI001F3A204F|nr:hypothetical protein [Alicyclobacillus tolerans]MCF8568335.1 hypothetical protein [Alicyclobacillus tolerans]
MSTTNHFVEPLPGDLLLVYPKSLIQRGIEMVEEMELLRKHNQHFTSRPMSLTTSATAKF